MKHYWLQWAMTQLFVGGQPAVDFLNTAYAEGIETLGDGRALLDWLVGAGLIDSAEASRLSRRFGGKAWDSAATEARKVREWLREWLARWRERPEADYSTELATLNKLMSRDAPRPEVTSGEDGLQIVERWNFASAESVIALIARHVAALITEEQAELVKACAGPSCTLWFVDRTKAHRRTFCSASGCGNRAKVAAFRQRQRE
jgi:predicted RNA-binding Zn ribbon-like protein